MDPLQQFRRFLPRGLSLSEQDLSLFQSSLALRQLGKGDRLLASDSPEPIRGIVTRGCLRVYFTEPDGTDRVVYFAPEGWCLTTIDRMLDRPASLSVEALEPTDVWVIDHSRPGSWRDLPVDRIWRVLAESALLAVQRRLVGGMRKTAAQRYLDFRQLYPGLDGRIAQYHVAAYLGISPEFLSKLRKRLLHDDFGLGHLTLP